MSAEPLPSCSSSTRSGDRVRSFLKRLHGADGGLEKFALALYERWQMEDNNDNGSAARQGSMSPPATQDISRTNEDAATDARAMDGENGTRSSEDHSVSDSERAPSAVHHALRNSLSSGPSGASASAPT